MGEGGTQPKLSTHAPIIHLNYICVKNSPREGEREREQGQSRAILGFFQQQRLFLMLSTLFRAAAEAETETDSDSDWPRKRGQRERERGGLCNTLGANSP